MEADDNLSEAEENINEFDSKPNLIHQTKKNIENASVFSRINIENREKRQEKVDILKAQLMKLVENFTDHLGFLVDGNTHNLTITIKAPEKEEEEILDTSFIKQIKIF